MTFGERLKKGREAKGLSQKALGEALGISRETISKYENGERFPSFDRAISIAVFLNVSLLYLAGLADHEYLDLSTLDENTRSDVMYIVNKRTKKR